MDLNVSGNINIVSDVNVKENIKCENDIETNNINVKKKAAFNECEIKNANITNAMITNVNSSLIVNKDINCSGSIYANNIFQDNVRYLYDNNATLTFVKNSGWAPVSNSNYNFPCTAWGFYNTNTKRAIINTQWTYINFNTTGQFWFHFCRIVINGIKFYAIKYPQTGFHHNPLYPYVAGTIVITDDKNYYSSGSEWVSYITYPQYEWTARFLPYYGSNIKVNNENNPTYILRNADAGDPKWTISTLIGKINDLEVSSVLEPY